MENLVIKESDFLEDYTIHRDKPLGTGINGEVFVCTDNYFKNYAVKIITDCEEARREANIQWDCKECSHVVEIIDVYSNIAVEENKSYLYIVMELVDSGDFWEYIHANQVSEEEAKKLVKQLVRAVDHLHSLNIAHRDLKPENILMKVKFGQKVLKLTDFGFAEIDTREFSEALYTLYYAAPEVLRNDPCFNENAEATLYDKRCDLWSLGVIAYVLLMRYTPFPTKSKKAEMTREMYESIVTGNPLYEKTHWDKYSEDAQDFVFGLLQLNPEDRISAKDLLQHPWVNPNDSFGKLYW